MRIEPGAILGGKYRLVTPLAAGGMGSVWRAVHTELDTPVAIKCIAGDLSLSEAAVARFKQEARSAAQLRSPHVVQLLDYGVADGIPYIAMELLNGVDLGTLLETQGRLPLRRMRDILLPITKALTLAHDLRFVHRDIKPSNVFLARVGDDEVVKLVDFGIAKALNPTENVINTTSSIVGSPIYMSPEQSRGDPVDHRSDLWALGVVVFECLTGRVPFDGKAMGEVFAKIITAPAPAPSSLGVHLAGLDAFIARALAKDPAQRFQSARQFFEAFALLDESAPTMFKMPPAPRLSETSFAATPSPVAPRGLGLASTVTERRERPRIAVVALATAAVLGIVSGAGYFWLRARAEHGGTAAIDGAARPARLDEASLPAGGSTRVEVSTATAMLTETASPPPSVMAATTATPTASARATSTPAVAGGVRTGTRPPSSGTTARPSQTTDPLFGISTAASPGPKKK